ncbi:UNVERIFIED_CONTAM: hypothetical protein Sradi_3649700 [Sesamum radiatum]|uniref:Uncharacterized protein n=1 Tax=Sesamum radiatum TaxID=300843 RepID=A0AAW2QI61_SESRA
MIADTIKVQYVEYAQNSHAYSNPYSKRIDAMRMPTGSNLQNCSSSMENATRSSTSVTSLKHAITPEPTATTWSNNLSGPSKVMLSIGMWIYSQSQLIVGAKWKENSSTVFVAPDAR